MLIALTAMLMGESEVPREFDLAAFARDISRLFGSPKVMFSGIFFLALYTFHIKEASQVFFLAFTWVVFIIGTPVENLYELLQRTRKLWADLSANSCYIGPVVFRREPGLVTISVTREGGPRVGQLVVIPGSGTYGELGLVLDNYRLSDRHWSRALIFAIRVPKDDIQTGWGKENCALVCSLKCGRKSWLEDPIWKNKDDLIGAVIERSDINSVQIELYNDRKQLTEGRLLSVNISGQPVLYQITNGITDSELLQESNLHGFMSIRARKLGRWNKEERRFESVLWTPEIYAPVFLAKHVKEPSFQQDNIGVVPGTDFGIIADVQKLVTHNTAILGILGSGKSTLAIELICRMLNEGIGVFVVDITGEYGPALLDLVPDASKVKCTETNDKPLDEKKLIDGIRKYIELLSDTKLSAYVMDPNRLPINRRVTEITKLVAEQMLHVLRNQMSENARVCLVLEEAHSLAPEWNSASNRNDQYTVSATAKAIMQGRKYGFGTLIVTQRTANVTKSILNQCNTVFGLKVFDETGKEFLRNYYGEHYASLLSELPTRRCVAYGTALNAQTPLVIQLNDKDEFADKFQFNDIQMTEDAANNEE